MGHEQCNVLLYRCGAGVLVSLSFLHIVPKSIELDPRSPVFMLARYFVMHVLNRLVNAFVYDRARLKVRCEAAQYGEQLFDLCYYFEECDTRPGAPLLPEIRDEPVADALRVSIVARKF